MNVVAGLRMCIICSTSNIAWWARRAMIIAGQSENEILSCRILLLDPVEAILGGSLICICYSPVFTDPFWIDLRVLPIIDFKVGESQLAVISTGNDFDKITDCFTVESVVFWFLNLAWQSAAQLLSNVNLCVFSFLGAAIISARNFNTVYCLLDSEHSLPVSICHATLESKESFSVTVNTISGMLVWLVVPIACGSRFHKFNLLNVTEEDLLISIWFSSKNASSHPTQLPFRFFNLTICLDVLCKRISLLQIICISFW